MAVGDARVFPGFLTPVLTQLFFPKPQTTFLTCFCRGERRKYAGKKVRFNRGSNSQPPGHESDTLTTKLSFEKGLIYVIVPKLLNRTYEHFWKKSIGWMSSRTSKTNRLLYHLDFPSFKLLIGTPTWLPLPVRIEGGFPDYESNALEDRGKRQMRRWRRKVGYLNTQSTWMMYIKDLQQVIRHLV